MPIKVTEDLKKGSQLSVTDAGVDDTRVWKISGLTPGPGIRGQALFAVDAVTGARPAAFREFHPTISGCTVRDIKITPFLDSSDSCLYVATYKAMVNGIAGGGYSVTVSGTSGNKQLELDDFGKPLTIPYKDPSAKAAALNQNGTESDDGLSGPVGPPVNGADYASIPVFNPNTVIAFSFQTLKNPFNLAKRMRKKINEKPFQGEDPHAWMCRKFDFSSVGILHLSGKNQWSVTIEFELDVTANDVISGWQRIELVKDRETGRIPSDINPLSPPVVQPIPGKMVTGNGFGIYCPLTADFDDIGLPDVSKMI